MDSLPYIPGLKSADPGPLARFLPPLEDGAVSTWLERHAAQGKPGGWLLDPFGFSPRLALEAARAGYRVLVTANNPVTRFLLELAAQPPAEADLKAGLADLSASKKGDERLETHLQSLYLTTCANCGREIPAAAFLWRKGEEAPFARLYECKECGDAGERPAAPEDVERATKIAATDSLHRSRAFERVAALDDPDRVYAEEAIQHYLPRPLYVLTTLINRLDSLSLTPERRRALNALILAACDAGNSLWPYPAERPRPKQLTTPVQFRENNIWAALESGLEVWSETAASVPYVAWPNKLPESGGICVFEGRLKALSEQVRKEIPIEAALGALPRPNQAFWTLSALWAGWLWGREAVEPFKIALRRRRFDWGWSATALASAFHHLFDLLPLGTPVFGLLPEPEPAFLSSALIAAGSAGFDLQSLAMRTQHDPLHIMWSRGESLKREAGQAELELVRKAIRLHLAERGEPASYLHVHAAGLVALAEAHALKGAGQEMDEALRETGSLLESALKGDSHFIHYSAGESVETGMWDARAEDRAESLSDRVEIALVNFLQKNAGGIFLEIEDDLYPRFPGLLTPSKGLIYAVLTSYAKREDGSWRLRPEDAPSARRADLKKMTALVDGIGKRLKYKTRREGSAVVLEDRGKVAHVFYVLASALVGRALTENQHPPEKTLLVLPGGRAALAAYKQGRDPALAERMKDVRVVKFRLLRALAEIPILTRETFEEQIVSDPVEQAKGQMMMF